MAEDLKNPSRNWAGNQEWRYQNNAFTTICQICNGKRISGTDSRQKLGMIFKKENLEGEELLTAPVEVTKSTTNYPLDLFPLFIWSAPPGNPLSIPSAPSTFRNKIAKLLFFLNKKGLIKIFFFQLKFR